MVRLSFLFLGAVAATGCSFEAHSAQQAMRGDAASGGEAPAVIDAAPTIDAQPDAKAWTDAARVTGSLNVSSSTLAAGDTNLTLEGTADWAHWGHASATDFDHKIGANLISDVTVTNGAPRLQVIGVTTTASWVDGTPHQAVTQTDTAVGAYAGAGLRFTVPADTTPRTLRVYAGNKDSTETLDVMLSDNSAGAFTTTSTAGFNANHALYTITYNAASAGQTLTVTWTDTADSNGGFAMLMSATLQ